MKQAKVKAEDAQMQAAVAVAAKVGISSTQRSKALEIRDVDEAARLGELLKNRLDCHRASRAKTIALSPAQSAVILRKTRKKRRRKFSGRSGARK